MVIFKQIFRNWSVEHHHATRRGWHKEEPGLGLWLLSLSSGRVVTELRSETNCYGSPVLSRNILIMFVMTVRIIITGEGEECFNERDQVRITGKLGARENTNYLDKPFPHHEAIFRLFQRCKTLFYSNKSMPQMMLGQIGSKMPQIMFTTLQMWPEMIHD